MKFENYLKLKYGDCEMNFEELLKSDMPFLLCHAVDKMAEMALMQKYDEEQNKLNDKEVKTDESKNN